MALNPSVLRGAGLHDKDSDAASDVTSEFFLDRMSDTNFSKAGWMSGTTSGSATPKSDAEEEGQVKAAEGEAAAAPDETEVHAEVHEEEVVAEPELLTERDLDRSVYISLQETPTFFMLSVPCGCWLGAPGATAGVQQGAAGRTRGDSRGAAVAAGAAAFAPGVAAAPCVKKHRAGRSRRGSGLNLTQMLQQGAAGPHGGTAGCIRGGSGCSRAHQRRSRVQQGAVRVAAVAAGRSRDGNGAAGPRQGSRCMCMFQPTDPCVSPVIVGLSPPFRRDSGFGLG